MTEEKDNEEYLKVGDLVQMTGKDSIGYVTCKMIDELPQLNLGDEVRGYCSIRWIDGELKTQGWISISTKLKDGKTDMLTLITDKKKIKWYQERYPFVNSIDGTINIASSAFPPQPQ